jgi:hypothetical protein
MENIPHNSQAQFRVNSSQSDPGEVCSSSALQAHCSTVYVYAILKNLSMKSTCNLVVEALQRYKAVLVDGVTYPLGCRVIIRGRLGHPTISNSNQQNRP